MSFPDNSLTGIQNDSLILQKGVVSAGLFQFRENPIRSDSKKEQSINWQDDQNAIVLTLNQQKLDGTYQFQSGIAVIPRDKIDWLIDLQTTKGFLSYERQPLQENPYHGNILVKKVTPKPVVKLIMQGLALIVSEIIPR